MESKKKMAEAESTDRTEYEIKAKVPDFSGDLFRVRFEFGRGTTFNRGYAAECFYSGCEVKELSTGKVWERGRSN